MFRAIVKRHAITGSRLGPLREDGQPPGSSGDGRGLFACIQTEFIQFFVTGGYRIV
ncbi:MAG: hypothetical protein M0Q91_10850 [Methanoregula sp.]|nr:hypothetical protein [Methanoregula sp.]